MSLDELCQTVHDHIIQLLQLQPKFKNSYNTLWSILLFKLVYVIYKHPLYNVSRLWYNRLCTYYTLNK